MSVFAWMFAGVIVDWVDRVLPRLGRLRRDAFHFIRISD